jgi:hypothetical protein
MGRRCGGKPAQVRHFTVLSCAWLCDVSHRHRVAADSIEWDGFVDGIIYCFGQPAYLR